MKSIQDCDIELPELEPVWQDPSKNEEHFQAMQKIQALICVRERCEKELYDRLIACEFSPKVAKDAVSSALSCGLVSNERYASAFIRGKTSKGWGRVKIISRLHENGITDDVIDSCKADFASYDQELDRALQEIRMHPSHSKKPHASLMRRLINKGYSYEIAQAAVDELMQD